MAPIPPMEVRFVPAAHVLESVLAQIKAGHVAYSVFSLGRMFLDKPERYDVRARHGLRLSISTSRMAGQFRPEMGHGRGQPGAGPPEALTRLRLR